MVAILSIIANTFEIQDQKPVAAFYLIHTAFSNTYGLALTHGNSFLPQRWVSAGRIQSFVSALQTLCTECGRALDQPS